ncbi:Mpo1 family 2-hydroxy fatty acid dioxygenase [Gaetbulibacter saemankumensis]|uniref:Mpo1 family 2-hydroxy fatty acid dioxygenase n=1 Tax=Gaetbulibacter saemankumensis TaxID=311208 RepID=UPI0003F8A935|nr:Mpo1-like protein [Gaetbulibacter saemankumensis]
MRKIDKLLNEYAESHQTIINIRIHYICVPAIFFSLIGLLSQVSLVGVFGGVLPSVLYPYLNLGVIVLFFGLLYYLRLSYVLFFGMLIFSIMILYGVHFINGLTKVSSWKFMLGIFVVAWIGQFIGHNHEGKKPSFLKDLQFLLIGPAWTLSHLLAYFKIKY